MDSISNLPLLEIAEEDDSLLFDDSTASTTTVFPCSPLIPLRSNPLQTEGRHGGAVESEYSSSSLSDSNANKENADWNKQQKLSVERQQMKKKKRGGGYNLRKSLAWDRAFFTEQGVLNPMELSMISGTAKAGLNLEVIHEEESVGTSSALQEIEEDLFVHSSDAVPVKDRKIGSSPKPNALAKASPAPVSLAKRKVLTVNDAVGNRAKRNACPRGPVASSSLKRPDTVTAPSKELKVTRIPGPKLDASASSSTARSGMSTAGPLKRNQYAHPATNLQKHAGVKSLSKNPKTATSNPKVGPVDKCSVTRTLAKRVGKHLDNSVSERCPPSRMHQSETEANKMSKACLPPRVSDIGEKKQQTQVQTTKLSGLRMPSPSLGFFSHSQAKAPSSHSQLQKSSKPGKPAMSNIPTKLQNLETNSVNEARLPHAPGIRSEIVKGAAKNCTEELSLLDVKSESNMQLDDEQMAGVEVAYDSMGSEKIGKQEKAENILEHVIIKSKEQGELHRSENASSVEDVVFPRPEKKLLSKNHTQEQLEKEADHPNVLSKGYQSVFQEPQSMHYHGMQRTSIVKGSISNTMHNVMEQDEDEQIKLLPCDVLTSNESLVLQAKHGTSFKDSRLSGEFKEYDSVKTALINSSLYDFSENVLGGSILEHENGAAADFVTSGEDVQVHLLNGHLSVNCNETTESNLEAVNQQLQGKELRTTSASIVGENSSIKENESHVNNCHLVYMTTLSSKGSPQKSIPEIKCSAESKPIITEIEECQFPVDDQPGFIQTTQALEGCEKVIDSKAMHRSSQAFELDRLREDCIAVSAATCNTEVSNVSQESKPFHGNKLKEEDSSRDASMHYDAPCDVHEVTQVFDLDGSNEDCIDVSATACNNELRDESSCWDSSMHYDAPSDVREGTQVFELDRLSEDCIVVSATACNTELRDEGSSRDASMHYDVPCDVCEKFEQQTTKINYSKANEMLCEDESLVLSHGHLLDQSEFSEVSADFILNTKDSTSIGAQNSSDCLQQTLLPQLVQEVDHTNREIEESYVGGGSSRDASMHYDVPWDLPGNSEQETSKITYSKANEMLCEDESLVLNQSHLLDQSEFSEVSADFISIIKDSTGIGAEKSSDCLQQALLIQLVQEVDYTNGEIEESHVEDVQVQSSKEDPVAFNCNSKHCVVTNDTFPLADNNNNISENSHLSDFQRPDAVVGVDSENVDNILHLDGDCLPTNIASSEEFKKTNLFDGESEGCDIHTSDHNASSHHIQAVPVSEDRNLDVDEREVLLQMDDAKEGSSDTLPLVEVQLNDRVVSSECDSSLEVSKDALTDIVVAWKSEEHYSLSESSNLLVSDNPTFNKRIPQVCEVSSLNSTNFSDETETNIVEKDEFPNSELQHQSEDNSKIIHLQNSATKSNQEVPTVKPPPNAAPFSDEWLAAIEAAGEEILTMKSGAVQNSPPEKPQHEPGPWSPVKRKNQSIGPFDCTKHSIQHSSSE